MTRNALIGNPKDEEGRFKEEAVQIGFERLDDALNEYRAAHVKVRDQLILETQKQMDGEDEAMVEWVLVEVSDLYLHRSTVHWRSDVYNRRIESPSQDTSEKKGS